MHQKPIVNQLNFWALFTILKINTLNWYFSRISNVSIFFCQAIQLYKYNSDYLIVTSFFRSCWLFILKDLIEKCIKFVGFFVKFAT